MSEALVTAIVSAIVLIQGGQFALILWLLTIAMDNRARLAAIETEIRSHLAAH
jgi:hypothetical protein